MRNLPFLERLLVVPAWFAMVLFIAAMLFCVRDKKRKLFWVRFAPCAVVYNLLPFVMPGSYSAWYLTAGWFSFSYILFAILLAGIIYHCFDVPILNAVFYVASAYAIQNSTLHLYNLLLRAIAIGGGQLPSYANRIVGLLTHTGVILAYYFFLIRRIRATFTGKMRIRMVIISVMIVLVVYVLDMWIRARRYGNLGIDIYAILVNALMLFAQAGLFRESTYEREQIILRELLRQEGKQQKLSEQSMNIMNIKFHDLKHRIEAYKNGDDDIAEIERALDVYDAFVKSGNRVLDIVLAEKSLVCKSKNIKLGVIADGAAMAFMKEADIGALFGNILSNAIEAAEKADAGERAISLNVVQSKGFLVIREDNRSVDNVAFEGGLPKSTKNDPFFHGYGTKSIRHITEKYGGLMNMHCDGGVFGLEILIPLPQAKSA